jgi:hypothetical protein
MHAADARAARNRMPPPLLLLLLLFSSSHAADHHVTLIRQIVRPELQVPSITDAVGRAIATPSSCVPPGAITLSVINKHHVRLRPVQFALIAHRECFMRRLVSVCFNNVSDSFGECVRSTFVVPPSDFRRSNYANLIWAKWKIISDALTIATTALWLDADVLILRNPWAALHLLGSSTGATHDIRYQSEPPPFDGQDKQCARPMPVCNGCATVNGGQLLVRSHAFANAMYQLRPRNLSNTERLDQDWADAIIHRNASHFRWLLAGRRKRLGTFSSCVLPGEFTAQCWFQPSFFQPPRGRRKHSSNASLPMAELRSLSSSCARVTHHFNCVANRREKGSLMKALVADWRNRCGNHTADE